VQGSVHLFLVHIQPEIICFTHKTTKTFMIRKIDYPVNRRSKSVLSQLFLTDDLLVLCIYISLDMNFHLFEVFSIHCLIRVFFIKKI